jgi:phage terminase large subunit-like protein
VKEKNKMDINKLLSSHEGRRILSASSPVFFDSYYLNLDEATHRTKCLEKIDELEAEAKKYNNKQKLLVLHPRSHGKSFLAISYCVRQICMNRNTSILFISASAGQAEKRVRLIKQFLESEKVTEDWASNGMPEFRSKDAKWTSTQMYVNREGASVDPTLEAIGSGGKITGAHVDIVIIDDLEDDTTTGSAGVRAKTREWLNATVMPILNQGGIMLVIGTRKHSDDVYEHMKQDPTFSVIEQPAIVKWPESYKYVVEKDSSGREVLKGVDVKGEYEVLWPEYRPLEYLLMERRSMGSTLFAREMQNEVMSVEDSVIKPNWFESSKNLTYCLGEIPSVIDIEECSVIQAWDLSIESDKNKAKKGDTDFTVGVTIAKDEKGHIWLLDLYRDRGITQQDILNAIHDMYVKWKNNVKTIMVEKNSFGALYVQQLQKTALPVKGVTMTRHNALKVGIHKIAVLFENGLIHLPIGNEHSRNLIEEFKKEGSEWPVSKHDDILDSFYHAINEVQRISANYSIAIGDKVFNSRGETIDETHTMKSVVDDVLSEIGAVDSQLYSEEEKRQLERFGIYVDE